MPRDHALVDRVRAALGGTPHVEEKKTDSLTDIPRARSFKPTN
jgi:hypothetical protein